MIGAGLRVVLAGGGTGGHVIPAIAVAEEIARRGGSARFVGTRDRIEARLVPEAGFGIDFIRARPLAGGGTLGAVRGMAAVPAAVARSAMLLRSIDPDVVLGVGGYVAGPVVLAARLLATPAAVLEQNATVGLANRLLARLVSRAFVSYEETAAAFPRGRAELTGNPVPEEIARLRGREADDSPERRVRVLVMGGSQGALTIDERVPSAAEAAGLGREIEVRHQCGRGREDQVREAWARAGVDAEISEFITDTAGAYRWADLVVARAGATTVSELTVAGLPAVLVPYPHHADRQQEKNAAPMVALGAAVPIDEKTTGVAELADAIASLVRSPSRRAEAARASASLGRPDAASRVVDGLERLAGRYP